MKGRTDMLHEIVGGVTERHLTFDAINLDMVLGLTRENFDENGDVLARPRLSITFSNDFNYVWSFSSKEIRDREYDKIIQLSRSHLT